MKQIKRKEKVFLNSAYQPSIFVPYTYVRHERDGIRVINEEKTSLPHGGSW